MVWCMSQTEMLVVGGAYAVALGAAIWFTRATSRRVAGAALGGIFAGAFGMAAMVAGEKLGLWQVPLPQTPGLLALFYVAFVISMSPVYLITWRLARRFGWRGLTVFLIIVAVIGPPRDYMYTAAFPAWMTFAPGFAPVLGDAAVYVALIAIGHLVMWLVAGRSTDDPLHERDR
jgi:hypothetical protein